MVTIHVILMILAIVCFLLAAIGVSTPRGNLVAAGLCLWALAVAISGFK
jgi:hypothetical protein